MLEPNNPLRHEGGSDAYEQHLPNQETEQKQYSYNDLVKMAADMISGNKQLQDRSFSDRNVNNSETWVDQESPRGSHSENFLPNNAKN